ncbi:MAG: hypothetical protein ACTSP4_05310 [Candidatus Hodarchaeales archaeon]
MSLENILLGVSKYLGDKQIPYVVVGGWAAIAWGRQRTTFDIDLIIDQNKLDLSEFIAFLKSMNMMICIEDLKAAIKEKSHASILYEPRPNLRIDFKGVYTFEDREAIETSIQINLEGIVVNIGSPENLIAHKLKFGSERDLEDALVVYIVQVRKKRLDSNYLERLCNRLKVTSELKDLIKLAKQCTKMDSLNQSDMGKNHY